MRATQLGRGLCCCALLSSLAACSDSGLEEIKSWMAETRRTARIVVVKVAEPKKFTPFLYGGKNSVDPYNPSKLALALAKLKSNTNSVLKPDVDRRKEPLESYPLDTLKRVGTLEKPGAAFALLQADKNIFQIKVGNYIGQNYGVVTKVSESVVEIKEIVQDAAGDWVERIAKLELQESKK